MRSSSAAKMAAGSSVPSDLYQHVYTFLLENKFTKAAKEFLKQAKVVSTREWSCVSVSVCRTEG